MSDGRSGGRTRSPRRSKKWTSFVATSGRGRIARTLQEEGNPAHRARVVQSQNTLLIQVSDEDGSGWTVLAIDRESRQWAVAQRKRQMDAAQAAYEILYT
jgi:hypothetical protein